MHHIPPPTWPDILRKAREMRKIAESLTDPKAKREAEIETLILERRMWKQMRLDNSRY